MPRSAKKLAACEQRITIDNVDYRYRIDNKNRINLIDYCRYGAKIPWPGIEMHDALEHKVAAALGLKARSDSRK